MSEPEQSSNFPVMQPWLQSNFYWKSCGYAVVEFLHSSCRIATADKKKICTCPPLKYIYTPQAPFSLYFFPFCVYFILLTYNFLLSSHCSFFFFPFSLPTFHIQGGVTHHGLIVMGLCRCIREAPGVYQKRGNVRE
jgi:hypothetical protein